MTSYRSSRTWCLLLLPAIVLFYYFRRHYCRASQAYDHNREAGEAVISQCGLVQSFESSTRRGLIQCPDAKSELKYLYNISAGDLRHPGVANNLSRNKDYEVLLLWWKDFAKQHGIQWALGLGTALGHARHPHLCFIPYDGDADIYVEPRAAEKLVRLAESAKSDGGLATVQLIGEIPANSPVVDPHSATTRKTQKEPVIIVHPDYERPMNPVDPQQKRRIWDCKNNLRDSIVTNSGEDMCAWIWVVGRVVFKGRHLDLFFFNRKEVEGDDWVSSYNDQSLFRKNLDQEAVKCSMVSLSGKALTPKSASSVGSSVGAKGVKGLVKCYYVSHKMASSFVAEDCKCGSMHVRCLDRRFTEEMLVLFYSRKWRRPDAKWDGTDWTRRNRTR